MPDRKAKANPIRLPLTEKDTSSLANVPHPAKSAATSAKGKKRDIDSLMDAANAIVSNENQNQPKPGPKSIIKRGEIFDPDQHPNGFIMVGSIPEADIAELEDSSLNMSDMSDEDEDEDDLMLNIIKYSPSQIRNKIRSFINSGEMKVYQFCDAIGVSNGSYQRFMKESGQKGQWSDTYAGAHMFFLKRERMGIKIPRKKKNDNTPASKKAKTTSIDQDRTKMKSPSKNDLEDEYDVSSITLDGEDKPGGIAVYDTCDDVRTKINAHLREPGVTMASFNRAIARTYKKQVPSQEVTIQHKQLKDFLEKHGARSGCTSKVFYGSYIYFEKLRIKQNKPKSKKREEMEKMHGTKGLDIKTDQNHMHFWGMEGESFHEDSYGRTNLISGRGRKMII
ncbi:hypothetical protein L486_07184 [Kwoniella mangroviensis CBS 10435]|uniref:DUF7726 domain-containing protein n=1 Tax=Kwoniella mangroviensis CBS 10435 TaxID=1331196 RepID=A0A1B9II55_9TREE|nr:hypothetical protein L486_07184 [Kwoniella mangroviensis CBS 10435]